MHLAMVKTPFPRTASMSSRPRSTQRGIQSIDVGMRLLAVLAEASEALALKDLAARAGMSPAKAHAYLVSFARAGLVEQDRANGRYDLGPQALRLGLASLSRLDPVRLAIETLPTLAERTGHSVAVAVWGNHGPTIVHFAQSARPIHVNMRTGTVMSMTETATGIVLTAHRSKADIEAVLAALWPSARERAQVRARIEALAPVYEAARRRGLARAQGHPVPGVHAFSAPVFDHTGEAVLALTVLGPAAEFDVRWKSAIARELQQTAAALTSRNRGTGSGQK